MEYLSSASSHGSPEELKYYIHEHPLVSYDLWELDQKRLKITSLSKEDYIVCITSHPVRCVLFQTLRGKNCNCYVFKKVGKCFHVLNFIESSELHEKMEQEKDCFRSLLAYPTEINSALEEINLIGQNENNDNLPASLPCPTCKNLITNVFRRHVCSPISDMKAPWKIKLPFLCEDLKINLTPDAIMLHSNELHFLIPFISQVYDTLAALKIRTSLIQIIAQDPKYQETLGILESQDVVDEFFTYHLYLYIKYRLLPYLQRLPLLSVKKKILPIFTVIRSENHAASKDVLGFNEEEEIAERLAECPGAYKEKVQKQVSDIIENYEEGGIEYFINIIQNGLSTSVKEEWSYVLKCLDVKLSVYKGIRHYAKHVMDKGGDTCPWSTKLDFFYGKKKNSKFGVELTNIFGVLPQNRIHGNLLKKALLLSRGIYAYEDPRIVDEKLLVEFENY